MGLILAALVAFEVKLVDRPILEGAASYWVGAAVLLGLGVFMVQRTLSARHDVK